jgi:hypothetical protein
MFCMSLVLLHQLHAVSISVLLLISLKYIESSHYALCQCVIFSNHPLFSQYCHQIYFLELKTNYIFNCVKYKKVWQFNAYIFIYINTIYKEKNQCIWKKNGSREYSKGNKTVPGKVATTHTEDGHKQVT